MSHTISVTFTDEEWQAFETANAAMNNWLSCCHGRRWRQWVIRRAAYAVLRELERNKEIVFPMAVTLRTETREETDVRCGRKPQGGRWDFGSLAE